VVALKAPGAQLRADRRRVAGCRWHSSKESANL